MDTHFECQKLCFAFDNDYKSFKTGEGFVYLKHLLLVLEFYKGA